MKKSLEKLKDSAWKAIAEVDDLVALEKIEQRYFGRKTGELTAILRGLSDLSAEEKKEVGALANEVKEALQREIEAKKSEFEERVFAQKLKEEWIDTTLPGTGREAGHLHPNTQIQYELEDLFSSLGFMILDGPELESEYYNFEALNVPAWHPARDMQDTFYVEEVKEAANTARENNRMLLRTHTSPMQVRALQKYGAPLRAIVPGRVFRNEATDASHEHTFYQLEGLMVDKEISISHVIAVMKELLRGILKTEAVIRLRPGYFPFVEPGFELDIQCLICGGKGCGVCKQSGWVELMPCGMVHPNVLKHGGVDPDVYSGFAFGLGLTRLVMMRYGMSDIRLLQGGDLRFLEQF